MWEDPQPPSQLGEGESSQKPTLLQMFNLTDSHKQFSEEEALCLSQGSIGDGV